MTEHESSSLSGRTASATLSSGRERTKFPTVGQSRTRTYGRSQEFGTSLFACYTTWKGEH